MNNNETTKNNHGNNHQGLVVAELIKRITCKTKNDETFYVLEISLRKTITEMVRELRGESNGITINNKEVLYVFANRGKGNKYAFTLKKNCLYAFWFTKFRNPENQEDYFHVLEWKKLGYDAESIVRTLRLALPHHKEEEEEETLTNQELLMELKERMRNRKISFKLSANNNEEGILDIDTDLKDNESNFWINLQEKTED